MYLGQPLFAEVDQFLRGEGFVLHRFFPITSRVIAPLVLDNERAVFDIPALLDATLDFQPPAGQA